MFLSCLVLSLTPVQGQKSTAVRHLVTPPAAVSALLEPQLVTGSASSLSRPRQKQLTVLAVAFALCNDVLLLLMLVPMLPFLLPAGATSARNHHLALSCDSPDNRIALHDALHIAYTPRTLHVRRTHMFTTRSDACLIHAVSL